MNLAGATPVQIDVVGAEGRNFELQSVFQDNDDAEIRADRIRTRENSLHLLRVRIGSDVDIFRRKPADHVPNATAGEVGDVAVVAEFCRNGARSFLHSRKIVYPKGRAVHRTPGLLPSCAGDWGQSPLPSAVDGFWRRV